MYQQTTSVVSKTNQGCYYGNKGCFSVYGFEYKEGYEKDSECSSFGFAFGLLKLLFVQRPTFPGLTMGSMCGELEREGPERIQYLKSVLVLYRKSQWLVFCQVSSPSGGD